MSLPTRQLGKNGPQVTALGLGLMGISVFYGPKKPDSERFAFLDHAYEKGERFWDSADMYGDSEDLIGQWFKKNPEKRKDIFLATKFANFVAPDGTRSIKNEPEYVHQACEKSLKRLGVDQIDLYYCHRFSGKVPAEKVIGAMKELVDEGKVKYLGISECSAETLRRCHAVHPISAVQIEYSPFTMDIEYPNIGLLKACRELGVATVAYSPLGRGFISGSIRKPDDFQEGDFRKFSPRFAPEHFSNNLKLVDHIGELAKKKGCTPSQLTLTWLLAQGEDIIPIPGTTRISALDENLASLSIKLTDAENAEIRKAVESAEIKGGRYPEQLMSSLFADTPPLS